MDAQATGRPFGAYYAVEVPHNHQPMNATTTQEYGSGCEGFECDVYADGGGLNRV
ncbi:MAG TPA: hypothetical protein VNJ09_09740 [Chthonomonadales bacterium]|nr:hypothetical protein [Chthonomonadales bacterium]